MHHLRAVCRRNGEVRGLSLRLRCETATSDVVRFGRLFRNCTSVSIYLPERFSQAARRLKAP